MKITKVLSQFREGFTANVECEFCGFTELRAGNDLINFRDYVLPYRICIMCYRSSHNGDKAKIDYGGEYE